MLLVIVSAARRTPRQPEATLEDWKMRIVEYNGAPVKRQTKVGPDQIKVVFYDRAPIIVTSQQWAQNARHRFFDDPAVRRRDVVRPPSRRSWW
jgi:hypothetical protein